MKLDFNNITILLPALFSVGIILYISFYLKDKFASAKLLKLYLINFIVLPLGLFAVKFSNGREDNQLINVLALLFFVGLITIPPTFYLYVKSLVQTDWKSTTYKQKLKHYFPAIILFILNFVGYLVSEIIPKDNESLNNFLTDFLYFIDAGALLVVFLIQNVYYIIQSIRSYKQHTENIQNIFSYADGVNLNWMRYFILGYVIFISGLYLDQLSDIAGSMYLIEIISSSYLIFIAFTGTRQVVIFDEFNSEVQKDLSVLQKLSEDYKNAKKDLKKDSIIDESKQIEIKQALEDYMETEKPYLNPKLSITDLAQKINSNTKYLSFVINENYNSNFVTFINKYRIEESKKMLKSTDFNNYTIEAIGEMSGFKSKSAFNTAFKKITGKTPSEFKNS